ncbi:[protein-PII] uridylyltransferase [Gordonia jinhuaensis]|uniref:Bifunctional uridylyltransferase/uridylyl-removing enzyme n=1 Tax=Gordonia jinhuaensis TaxID=1517702 RepID=A0A916T3H1_9ACTN|nr:[protein-PII] uridylyltransferase [Gordonia jinhuaensis]GGB30348.1 bifunctional uridylyltransferase/uridylyl-removing enzyme [Gordonia jinhuaensis]
MPFVTNNNDGPASDDSSNAGPRPSPGKSGFSPPAAATDLVEARRALLAQQDGPKRLDAAGLRQVLVDLHDFWLTTKGAEIGIRPNSGFAIVAVGGLGRQELLPYSDLDLILLHDDMKPAEVSEVADALWYPLWDAHIALDHSVRTVPQALQVASSDMTAALAMLDARHIAGDEELTNLLIGGIRRQWRTDIRHRFGELVDTARDRWKRSGDIAHRAEPDLKNGRGGLRDVQMLDNLAIAQLTDGMGSLRPDSPGGGLRTAYTRLLDIRTELHRIAGRPRESLRAQDADEIGAALRIGDRFDLARTISDCARTVSYSVDLGLRTSANALPRRGLSKLRRAPLRRPLDEGVVEHAGEVVLARSAIPSKDPGLILRVASAAARTGLPIGAATLSRLADHAPELREPWPPEALSDLLVLLGTGSHMVDPIEALDRTGLWGRLLPEWGAVRDLPPRDAVHIWTVDRHLVETTAYASTMTTRVSRPDLLVLGALLHDLGKGRGADHSIVGAELAAQIGNRIGLWPQDVALLSEMVRYHLLLPSTATRRDLDDPETAQSVVDALGGSRVLLELLAALAEADSLATGPGVWGEWKASLVGELVRRCLRLMDGEPLPQPEPLSDKEIRLAENGGVTVEIDTTEGPHTFEVTMIAPDGPGMLSKMAGVLALNGLRLRSANARSHAGSVVNTFVVVPTFGDPPEPGLIRQQLLQAIDGRLDIGARLDARERDMPTPPQVGDRQVAVPALFAQAPPRVLWIEPDIDAEREDAPVTLELRAGDRLGLLARVAAVIEGAGASVEWAKVTTLGGTVVDTFGVDLPADSAQMRASLEEAILAVVPPPAPAEDSDEPEGGAGGSPGAGVPIG